MKIVSRARRSLRWLAVIYLLLLAASHLTQFVAPASPTIPLNLNQKFITLPALTRDDANVSSAPSVRFAYREYNSANNPDAPTIVLLQGSPGSGNDFRNIAPLLAQNFRVIAPDLPGFGASASLVKLPDYSNRAHAFYVLKLLDALGVERAHLVGFSMSGGVVLRIEEIAPQRVASLTMLAGIGVQEYELLGDYHLNHGLHGLQLALWWLIEEGFPHFGKFDQRRIAYSYARNFYDTDQRPLRAILAGYDKPMNIIHSPGDVMVPYQVAEEHHRLVPQSELHTLPEADNHFFLFTRDEAETIAPYIGDFVKRVEQGKAPTRADADPARIAQAALSFNRNIIAPARGVTWLILLVALALATLISEDLACITAGMLAAEGRIGFAAATLACLAGIFIGDVLLFFAGRYIGRPALRRAPLKWFISAERFEQSSAWFRRRGMAAIFLSRFVPGMRLPTYLAAGLLDTSFIRVTLCFFIAAALWTPLLVGVAMRAGGATLRAALLENRGVWVKVFIVSLLLFFLVKFVLRLSTWRGRRTLVAKWRRMTRWEFWQPYIFYPPVVLYVLWLGVKYKSFTLFTCANPALPEGGFVGESKAEILRGLSATGAVRSRIARFVLVPGKAEIEARMTTLGEFMYAENLSYPIVLKPDQGERGAGVAIVKDETQARAYLEQNAGDTIAQEYIAGAEFGVFYYRLPEEVRGHIFAITDKRFPTVTGDSKTTLENLIWRDERAVCMADAYCRAQGERLNEIIKDGEKVQLVELGTHCRGAIFLDGTQYLTDKLESVTDELTRVYEGFYFGRYDVRVSSAESFMAGDFKVIELNGVTSEATSIYDPKNSLFTAYKILFAQWRLAFEIGAQNRARGCRPTPIIKMARIIFGHLTSGK